VRSLFFVWLPGRWWRLEALDGENIAQALHEYLALADCFFFGGKIAFCIGDAIGS